MPQKFVTQWHCIFVVCALTSITSEQVHDVVTDNCYKGAYAVENLYVKSPVPEFFNKPPFEMVT
jgi:hypothetical protein